MSGEKQTSTPQRGMTHRGPMIVGGEKARDFKGSMKRLYKYITGYRLGILLVLIFAISGTVFAIVGPKMLGNATTELFNGLINKISGGSGIDFDKIAKILMELIVLYGISSVLTFFQGYIMNDITMKITYKMRKEISEKINKLPMSYFDKKQHGEVLSIITNDVDTLSTGLNQSASQIITSVVTILGILVMMLTIDWIMTLSSLIIIPLSGVLLTVIIKKSQKHFRTQQDYLGHVNGQVEEIFGGVTIVQAFNNDKQVVDEFEKANEILYKSAWKAQFYSSLMMPMMNFVGNIGYVIVAILGGYLTVIGRITVGNIQSFISYSKSFTQPLTQVAQISTMLQSMAAAAERIFAFFDEPEEADTADGSAFDNAKVSGQVDFEGVRFGYEPDKIVINNFNAGIKPGQKIAIVGPTGAGKTTMVKLLMRFYDVNEGSVKVDGLDIRSLDRHKLRELYAMVLQDTWLFNGTIMENIRFGKLNATDDEVIQAAKAAHAHHFIQTLQGGYNMILNEETSNISQGQKQLLTIARAILADRKILILDEATSSVDTRTEILIQDAMDNLMRGRTSFVIAHRLSTIRNADLILVINLGDIVEQGTHEELLAQDGFYASLYNSQFEDMRIEQ